MIWRTFMSMQRSCENEWAHYLGTWMGTAVMTSSAVFQSNIDLINLHLLYSVQFHLPLSVLLLDKHVKLQQLIWIGLYIVHIIQKYNIQHLNTIDFHLTPSKGSEIEPFFSAVVKVKIWIFNVNVTICRKLIKNENFN